MKSPALKNVLVFTEFENLKRSGRRYHIRQLIQLFNYGIGF